VAIRSRRLRPSWGKFHQRSTSSFYALRSQKRKKTVKLLVFYALSESLHAKAARRMLMNFTPQQVSLRPVAENALLVGLVVAEVDDLLVGVHGEVAVLHGAGRVDGLVRTACHVAIVEQAAVELYAENISGCWHQILISDIMLLL